MSKNFNGNDAAAANSSPIPEIIDWQPVLGGTPAEMPENLVPWLIDNGSLTRKLVALSKDQFEVEVLRQDVATPDAAEANALKITQQTPVMIREVVLKGRGRSLGFCSKYSADDDDDGALGWTSNLIKPTAWRAVVSGSFNDT